MNVKELKTILNRFKIRSERVDLPVNVWEKNNLLLKIFSAKFKNQFGVGIGENKKAAKLPSRVQGIDRWFIKNHFAEYRNRFVVDISKIESIPPESEITGPALERLEIFIQYINSVEEFRGWNDPWVDEDPTRHSCHCTRGSRPFCHICGRLMGGF